MTMWTRDQNTTNTDEIETMMYTAEVCAYYPSLKGNAWDDELLPSGD